MEKRGGGWWALGAIVLAMAALLLGLYAGAYYYSVSPGPLMRRTGAALADDRAQRAALYDSQFGDAAEWLFRPMHMVDRQLRRGTWSPRPRGIRMVSQSVQGYTVTITHPRYPDPAFGWSTDTLSAEKWSAIFDWRCDTVRIDFVDGNVIVNGRDYGKVEPHGDIDVDAEKKLLVTIDGEPREPLP